MKSLNEASLDDLIARVKTSPIWLEPDEPAAFEVINPDGMNALVLIADHASNRVPRCLHQLGLDEASLYSHIAWDAGTAIVARHLSRLLDAPLVMSNYSRLVVDCNRDPSSEQAILQSSDGIQVPGNEQLSAEHIASRIDTLFSPYHLAIEQLLEARGNRSNAILSIHSFNPVLQGFHRPWRMGVCYGEDSRLAHKLLPVLSECAPGPIGDNEPYSIADNIDYSLPIHAASKGLAHVMIEIRRDEIESPQGALHYAQLLRTAWVKMLENA